MRTLYLKKENRDKAWRLKGGKRFTVHGQVFNPVYLEDSEDTVDRGIYSQSELFAVLYGLEVDLWA